ncbi:MAG: hypothetical protein H6644_15590 [Caldilineaceae bacterium]|nr:hypothetical protein [Caldilineaceae bacterium]
MLHSVDEALLARADLLADIFATARRRGQIGWSGASFYGTDLPEAALHLDLFDVIQVAYSVLDQRQVTRALPLARPRRRGRGGAFGVAQRRADHARDHLPAHLAPLRDRSRASAPGFGRNRRGRDAGTGAPSPLPWPSR